MSTDVYKNYTTTSVLTGVDVDQFTRKGHQYFKAYILPHIPENKDCKILEIGCGYGRYTTLLTNILHYKRVVGIDISEEQIEYAKSNYKLDNVFHADAVAYLKENRTQYDVVILMDVLEHLELTYAVALLEEVNKALSPGGKLIIQVPNGLSPMKPIFYGDVTHVRAFSVNSMSQILRMGGFTQFKNFALPTFVHSIPSFVHRMIWSIFVNPMLHLFLLLTHGSLAGGIYTSNLLTVAYKK